MSHLVYGTIWNSELRLMVHAVSEQEARRIYESDDGAIDVAFGSEPLAIYADDSPDSVEEGEHPATWVIDAHRGQGNFVVKFYDFFGTRYLEYSFTRQDNGRLFLYEVDHYEFADQVQWHDDWDWTTMTTDVFRPDGTSFQEVATMNPDGSQDVKRTEYSGGDFSATHWEDVPAFGEWDSITRTPRA